MHRAAERVRATFRDDVHEATRRPSEFGVRAGVRHHQLLHGIEVEGERRALSATLFAEERVVEVRSVHAHVVVRTALSGH